eukprot:1153667-Alexandrium_andersonii.AAC.1
MGRLGGASLAGHECRRTVGGDRALPGAWRGGALLSGLLAGLHPTGRPARHARYALHSAGPCTPHSRRASGGHALPLCRRPYRSG